MNEKRISNLIFSLVVPPLIYIAITFLISAFSILAKKTISINFSPLEITAISAFITIIILIPIFINTQKKRKDIVEKINRKIVLYMIPLSFSINIIINMIFYYIEPLKKMLENLPITKEMSNIPSIPVLIAVIVFCPIVEELIFRGFIYKTLKLWSNNIVAIIISSILFGLFHGNIPQAIAGFVCGILPCLVYDIGNNILYPIIFHILFNFTSSNIIIEEFVNKNSMKMQILLLIICIVLFIISLYQMIKIKNDRISVN